ncbi:thioredoxin-like protein AAED1, chloroplastic [Malania oleifera]|uniref:thioredoxin-like protein AAED1, chloroplastic n=1 Tax=Malania oleifera TaxID=397392 RepID=UPI0025AE00A4|nr:thioredoxin-like protein AAED1, chloroplastic [Malania oleifera]
MAISIPTAIFSNPLFHSRNNKVHNSTLPFPKPSQNHNVTFPPYLKDCSENTRHSSSRSCVTVSAVSGSPGIDKRSVLGEDTTDLLDRVEVFDLDGNGIPISDLWKDRKAVVAFARHFGCVLCRKRADYLASKKDRMSASGVALVLIGPGSIDQAKTFFEQTKFQGEVYADPSHSSYEALRFVSGASTTFTPGAGLKIIQLYMEGYRQDWKLSFERDTVTRGGWQQGGIIVAGPGKHNISYVHRDKEAGDDPDIEDILKVCCS